MSFFLTSLSKGEFKNENNNWYTYQLVCDTPSMNSAWASKHGFEYCITVGGIENVYRYAIIKKTVVYVCVDEDESGNPVMEKWKIVKHNEFGV